MEGLTTTTPETLVNLEEPPPLMFANISSTETTTPELTTSILMQTMQTLLHNGTTLSPEILQDLQDTTTENLEALARNETIGEQELKEWQKTSKCIQMGQFLVIFQLCDDLVSNIEAAISRSFSNVFLETRFCRFSRNLFSSRCLEKILE